MTFTPIPAGTTVWDVPLNAALVDLQNQITALNSNVWLPEDQGLISWTMDPGTDNSSTALGTGVLFLSRFRIRYNATINTLHLGISTAGASLTSGQNFAAIYSSSGTLLKATADQTTAWGSTGIKDMSLTSALAVTPGFYYFAMLSNGTTGPAVRRGDSSANAIINSGTTTSTLRFATFGSSQTSLPSSFTPSSMVAGSTAWMLAVN